MKSYYAPQQFCLVGKAWEIKAYLRKMKTHSNSMHQPLTSFLKYRSASSATHIKGVKL